MNFQAEKRVADNILTVPDLTEALINQYCVVEYDKLPYPGIILDVDDDSAEVKVMHRIGNNRFFWPLHDAILWYKKENVITILENEPEHVTGRHKQLDKDVWQEIVKKMDL